MNKQDDDFYHRLVARILISGKTAYFENEIVYLPYFGKDPDVIFRLFETFIKIKYPGYDITTTNTNVVKKLVDVAAGISQKPGIILQGPVGSGKTTLILTFLEFRSIVLSPKSVKRDASSECREIRYPSFITYNPSILRTQFLRDGFGFIEDGVGSVNSINAGEILFVDDFGLNSVVNYYGQEVNVQEELLYRRYDEFKRASNFELYMTTNLIASEVKKGFNPRLYSRLFEMASWEVLTGPDKRYDANILKQWPKLPEKTNSLFHAW